MMPKALHARLRSAIQRAGQENARVVMNDNAGSRWPLPFFTLEVHPVSGVEQQTFLVCFIDVEKNSQKTANSERLALLRAAELEDKFDAPRIQFEQLVHNLERSAEMEKGINDELRATSEDHISLQEKLQSLSEVFWRSTAIFGMT
jgi:hypothetical protein